MARLYKNFHVYTLAYDFVLLVYAKTNSFPKSEEQNITSQLRRASVQIPLNIAEGSAKASGKEFAYFLNVSYASAKEVEVLISLCKDLGYFSVDDYALLSSHLEELNAKLFLFIRSVESGVRSNRFQFFQKFEEKEK